MAIYTFNAGQFATQLADRDVLNRFLIAVIRNGKATENAAGRRALLVHFASFLVLPHSFCARTIPGNLFQRDISGQALPTRTKMRLACMLQSRYGQ
jgi:hypothetical protein